MSELIIEIKTQSLVFKIIKTLLLDILATFVYFSQFICVNLYIQLNNLLK